MEKLLNQFKILLESFLENPDQQLSNLSLLTPSENQQLVVDFNQTSVPFPADKTVVQLFEEQVIKTPDSVALIFDGNTLTYEYDEFEFEGIRQQNSVTSSNHNSPLAH